MRHRIARHAWQVVVGLALATPSLAGPSQEVHQAAITFDDLGAAGAGRCKALACQVEISSRIVNALKAQGILAVAFVNEGGLYVKGEVDALASCATGWTRNWNSEITPLATLGSTA